jgi:hypothetical protein
MGVLNVASRKVCMPKGTVAGFMYGKESNNLKNEENKLK